MRGIGSAPVLELCARLEPTIACATAYTGCLAAQLVALGGGVNAPWMGCQFSIAMSPQEQDRTTKDGAVNTDGGSRQVLTAHSPFVVIIYFAVWTFVCTACASDYKHLNMHG